MCVRTPPNAGYLAESERWFAFKADRLRQRVLAWLADEGIKPVEVLATAFS